MTIVYVYSNNKCKVSYFTETFEIAFEAFFLLLNQQMILMNLNLKQQFLLIAE